MHFRSDSWRFVARVTDQSSFEKYWILGKRMNYDLSQDHSLSYLLAMQILGQQVSLSKSQWLWAAFGGKWSHEAGVRAGRERNKDASLGWPLRMADVPCCWDFLRSPVKAVSRPSTWGQTKESFCPPWLLIVNTFRVHGDSAWQVLRHGEGWRSPRGKKSEVQLLSSGSPPNILVCQLSG